MTAGTRHCIAGAAFVLVLALTNAGSEARGAHDIPVPVPAPHEDAAFYRFLRDFRVEAASARIAPAVYERAVSGISRNRRVLELNAFQPEFMRPVWEYLDSAAAGWRIAKGHEMLSAHAPLFSRLEEKYGVQRGVLAALWGVETAFGRNQGTFNLFEALATLAYEGTRADYARRQLIAALRIAQNEKLDPREMTGSWAGAFGHTQFVPTTFLDHAVDGDGDGIRDLSRSITDALASSANYLKASGWRMGERWGEEVILPRDFAFEVADPGIRKTRTEWGTLGVTDTNGDPLEGDESAAIYLPAGHEGPAFLTLHNFDVLLTYNTAASYALAIGLLADRLAGRSVMGSWPRHQRPLARDQIIELQEDLTVLGYETGKPDGLIGNRTRAAIRKYQKANNLPPDGYPTLDLFYRILSERTKLSN
ncbi:MAG: lytic murein transglycosylase [Alphaproteobacteria bacterium]